MSRLSTRGRRCLPLALTLAAACSDGSARDAGSLPEANGQLFTLLPSSVTGVRFENRLTDSRELNVFTYRNFYNGGGVAIGDLTGDSLPEVVLTANQGGARIFLNEGGFRFRDITSASGVAAGKQSWTTGVTLADVNGDGRLDIHISHAGPGTPAERRNALWINQGAGTDGVPKFVDKAVELGVADEGYTTHAAFLDYDRDGDLDLFVLNNSPRPVSSFGVRNTRHIRHSYGGARLYRNDGSRFADVSADAGIHSPEIAFGLGIAVGDINRDGWPDVYVSNDFFERDYLYINRGNGTFTDSLDRQTANLTYFSMGLDVADVDNDGWPEIYTTDMLPEDEYRLKTTSMFEGWDIQETKVRNGYHYQFMRNMLQRNNRDGTFTDVGQMAGVSRTDWSWSALIVDLDLDGLKDIFVTNGLVKNITSQDYVAFLANTETMKEVTGGGRRRVDFLQLVKAMDSTPLPNYAFRNQGGLRFENDAKQWGLDAPSFSSGAAYGDLDGDGAPDLVVNNVNQEAFVYRNNARSLHKDRGYLRVRLAGDGANRFGIGARVAVHAGDTVFTQEQSPARGFQSSMDYVLGFGLGPRAGVDSVRVEWPDGRVSVERGVAANRVVTMAQAGGVKTAPQLPPPVHGALLAVVEDTTTLPFVHRENDFVDFDRERLIPKMLSTEGPHLAVADVNGDGLDDVFIGGAKEQPGSLLIQQRDGRFIPSNRGLFERDAVSEDVGALFFDANGDGQPDLYVVSGGNEFSEGAPALQDRLYLNDGRGAFHKAEDHLPTETASGSRAAAADMDGDGDLDLFVGARSIPWRYGVDPTSALLQNDGRGHFSDVTARLAPELAQIGMVTDALWRDVDGDKLVDLVIVGEWMPITIFRNTGGGKLTRLNVPGLAASHGWWNRIVAGDFTGDGRVDFVVGNLGTNTRLQASEKEPATLYVSDFDKNGFVEQILATYSAGRSHPFAQRDDLIKSIPSLKARFLKYRDYASKTVEEVLTPEQMSGALQKKAQTFASVLVRNEGNGAFTVVPLPDEAQIAPVYALLGQDVDGDGATDVLLAGNFDGVKPELGRMSEGRGLLLRGARGGAFTVVRPAESGFVVPGQARDVQRVRTAQGDAFIVARNNDRPLLFRPTPRRARAVAARSASGR